MKLFQVNVSIRSREGRQKIVYAGYIERLDYIFRTLKSENVLLPPIEDIISWHIREIDESMLIWLSRYQNQVAWTQPEVYNQQIH